MTVTSYILRHVCLFPSNKKISCLSFNVGLGINNLLSSLLRTIDDIDAEAILIQWFLAPTK